MYLYMWKFIILPKATPLDLGFRLGILQSKVVDLGYQLIVGVGFLHHHGIAHLDIKPENIVVLQNQLFIINFDILVCVNGPDALINHWCRTPGWMAPEIGHEDGPKCLYSPITGWKIGFYWWQNLDIFVNWGYFFLPIITLKNVNKITDTGWKIHFFWWQNCNITVTTGYQKSLILYDTKLIKNNYILLHKTHSIKFKQNHDVISAAIAKKQQLP